VNPIEKRPLNGPGSIEILAACPRKWASPSVLWALCRNCSRHRTKPLNAANVPLTPALLRLDPMFDPSAAILASKNSSPRPRRTGEQVNWHPVHRMGGRDGDVAAEPYPGNKSAPAFAKAPNPDCTRPLNFGFRWQGCIAASHPNPLNPTRGCLFHIAVLAGLLEPRLNRRSAIFGNFVLPFRRTSWKTCFPSRARWCLELGRASGCTGRGASPQLRSRCRSEST